MTRNKRQSITFVFNSAVLVEATLFRDSGNKLWLTFVNFFTLCTLIRYVRIMKKVDFYLLKNFLTFALNIFYIFYYLQNLILFIFTIHKYWKLRLNVFKILKNESIVIMRLVNWLNIVMSKIILNTYNQNINKKCNLCYVWSEQSMADVLASLL